MFPRLLLLVIVVFPVAAWAEEPPAQPEKLSALIASAKSLLRGAGVLSPSAVTTSPAGTPALTPEARQKAEALLAEARANPKAFKARYGPMAVRAMTGEVPPEFAGFLDPSMMTTSPSGAKTLTPAAQAMLRQAIAMARANPAAIKEQARALLGTR